MALLIGLDQGFTKTALAVADSTGRILFSDRVDCQYGDLGGKEDKAARAARYQQRLNQLTARATPVLRGQSVRIVYAGNVEPDRENIATALTAVDCTLTGLEACGDALGHYGLSSMPARCFVIGAGSGSIVAYVDANHNFITPPEPHWEIAGCGNLLSAGGLSNALLDLYVAEQLANRPGAITTAVHETLGARSRNHALYHYLYKFRAKIGRGRRLELCRQIPALLDEPEIARLIERAVADAVAYLGLLRDYFRDPAPQALVLGGSVALGIPGLREAFVRALPGLEVELAGGNPAEGAIRYRLAFPEAGCDAAYGHAYFSHWKAA